MPRVMGRTCVAVCLLAGVAWGQEPAPAPVQPSADAPKVEPPASPMSKLDAGTFGCISARLVGPALMSGRVGDLAVNPRKTSEWYVAVASGGVWKTTNAGHSFSPIFDSYGSYSIGCVTLDPRNPSVVWVGTGENNSQRSVSWGDGVYVSAAAAALGATPT
ncbi:MAG: WD40/YVTN/BNR-like repeat-containing protein, partial [Phycisphaerales bacterium]